MKTTRPNYEPPILRTHRLITQGIPADTGDASVIAAVESLQSLGSKSAKPLHIAWPEAPARDDLRPAPGTYPAAPARGKLDLSQATAMKTALTEGRAA